MYLADVLEPGVQIVQLNIIAYVGWMVFRCGLPPKILSFYI